MTVMWRDFLGFSFAGAIIILMALGIVLSAIIPTLDKWNKRYFIALFSLMFLCAVTCLLALLFWYDSTMALAAKTVYAFEDIFLSTAIFMPTLLVLHSAGESAKRSLLFKIVSALMVAYFVIVVAQFTEVFYYVTPDNIFSRGSLWALMLAPLVAILLCNVAAVIRRRKQLAKKYFIGFLAYMIPMTVTLVIPYVFGDRSVGRYRYGTVCPHHVRSHSFGQCRTVYASAKKDRRSTSPHYGTANAPAFYLQLDDGHLQSL